MDNKPVLVAKCGLDSEDMADVLALADEVRRTEGIALKWDLTGERVPGQASDFCCYDGGRLVGYAPLDGAGDALEVTAATLPSYRRRGTFRLLLGAARQEAQRRGAGRLLLVSYRASLSGAAAVQALNLRSVFSEYRLEAEATALPPLDSGRVCLILADESNAPASLLPRLHAAGSRYFLAELNGERIGQIGVVNEGESVYLRGFEIVPERRRRGYGRQLLAATLQMMLLEGCKQFALDVATDNVQALSLYKACGFREMNAYDYYDIPLADSWCQAFQKAAGAETPAARLPVGGLLADY